MVWQEFIQSSSGIENYPSDTPEFITFMTAEAEQIIPRKRNHPSLVIWCGGNELTGGAETIPLDNTHALLGALKEVVERLDPDRYWLPTSPTGRMFGNTIENIERDPSGLHDVHGPWEYQGVRKQYDLYNRSTSLLHSEFGVEGVTNLKTLNATIAPEHQAPATLDNPLWQHLGAWWNQQKTWQGVYGGEIADILTLVRVTQWLQAEGLRYAVESDMRRMYQNSGTLPWQFNEPYPMATCTSAVDYYGQAKPSYYAVAHAYSPIHVSARFDAAAWEGIAPFTAEIWVHNTSHIEINDVRLTVRLVGFDGKLYRQRMENVTLAANHVASLMTFESIPATNSVFFLDLELADAQRTLGATNRYSFAAGADLRAFLSLPTTTLAIEREINGDLWAVTVTNTGDQTAFYVWLEDSRPVGSAGYATFDRNYISLFSGESVVVRVQWQSVPESERALSIGAWNSVTEQLSQA
jgi:beta-mannosidase